MAERAKKGEVVEVQPAPVVESESGSILGMLSQAVGMLSGDNAESVVQALERLQLMHERAEDRAAERAFNAALAAFQSEVPKVGLNARSDVNRYATIDAVVQEAGPFLAKHGFAYSWDCTFQDSAVIAKCVLSHAAGHSRTSEFIAPIKRESKRPPAQEVAVARSYAMRYALLQVTGIVTGEIDTDGMVRRDSHGPDAPTISDEQCADLIALLDELGKDQEKCLAWISSRAGRELESLDQTPAAMYGPVMRQLRASAEGGK